MNAENATTELVVSNNQNSIQWCLLSHTNIGKTTLTRTLINDDVGQIEDAAHVTTQSQRYLLQRTVQGDELWLWDTPGFGDSVRLYERLKQQGNPLGWFLSNVWDRWRDKAFYLSQRALLAARDHSDVMLYLVNAGEDPADAGYWSAEMGILAWMNKPVIILLNQVGSDTTAAQTAADLQRWRDATAGFAGTVKEVLVLDAFTHSWWHERKMMQSIAPLLPQEKQPAYARLLQHREALQQQREQQSLQVMAQQLQISAQLHEAAQPHDGKALTRAWQTLTQKISSTFAKSQSGDGQDDAQAKAAMQRLLQGLQQADVQATQQLLELHNLDGLAATQIQEQLRSQLKVSTPLDPQVASLWGALTAGAATGLGADMMTGGMTLGAGALVGALVGALGFAGAAWGANKMFNQEQQRFQLSPEYLNELTGQVLLKYLVISHFGRGRGRYSSPSAPEQWAGAVQAALAQDKELWDGLWKELQTQTVAAQATPSEAQNSSPGVDLQHQLSTLLEQSLHRVLSQLYPGL